MREIAGCRICSNTEGNVTWTAREMMFGTGDEFAYVECAGCGCIQIGEVPADLSRHYPAHCFSPRSPVATRVGRALRDSYIRKGRGILGRAIHARYPDSALAAIHRMKLSRATRILDVGTGSGSFLVSLKGFGFRALEGIDPFLPGDVNIDGISLRRRTLLDVDEPRDLITFNHSLEHIAEQHETMERVAKLLTPGGVCIVRVPVVSWAWEHYRTSWVQLDPPRHLMLHTVGSLARLAAGAGLSITETLFDSTGFQLWGSELYTRRIALFAHGSPDRTARRVFSARELRTFRRRADELNAEGRGDQALFVLRAV